MTGPYLRVVRPSQAAGYAYSIQRNSRGSLPVYSDIRNGGTRYQVLLKNIKGDVEVRRYPALPNSMSIDLSRQSRP